MASDDFDVTIIGGGPAGAIAAGQLAAAGLRVLLADAHGDHQFKPGDGLPPVAKRILNECGIWKEFLGQGHIESVGTRSAWGSTILHSNDFIRSPDGMGYHLDRAQFDALLRKYALQAGAVIKTESPLRNCERKGGKWHLHWEGMMADSSTTSPFLVDATGRARKILRHLDIPFTFNDRQLCFYQLYRLADGEEPDEDCTALVESAEGGWWYSARLPNSQRIVMKFCDAGTPTAKILQTAEGFADLLRQTQHIGKELTAHRYHRHHGPVGTDARTGRATKLTGEGWCAIGDAAMAFDPLSSQGLITAMYTGMKVKNGIINAKNGDYSQLEQLGENMHEIYETFLANQAQFYRGEKRWPHSPYWKQRQTQ